MRIIELDIHRTFAEVAVLKDGVISRGGRVEITHQHIDAFAAKLQADDEVVLEATGNAIAVAERLRPHVGRVIVANAREVRLIAQAKIKTDKIDAAVLAQLHAAASCRRSGSRTRPRRCCAAPWPVFTPPLTPGAQRRR